MNQKNTVTILGCFVIACLAVVAIIRHNSEIDAKNEIEARQAQIEHDRARVKELDDLIDKQLVDAANKALADHDETRIKEVSELIDKVQRERQGRK